MCALAMTTQTPKFLLFIACAARCHRRTTAPLKTEIFAVNITVKS
jgi:hypothetical protein